MDISIEVFYMDIKWEKQCFDGKWYSVAANQPHIPMIEFTKDGKYKVRNANGKAVIEKNLLKAQKLALETAKKFEKFNKDWKEN